MRCPTKIVAHTPAIAAGRGADHHDGRSVAQTLKAIKDRGVLNGVVSQALGFLESAYDQALVRPSNVDFFSFFLFLPFSPRTRAGRRSSMNGLRAR